MFCSNCGSELEDGANFCANCGCKIENMGFDADMNTGLGAEQNVSYVENSEISHKKNVKTPLIVVIVLFIVAIAAFFTTKLNNIYNINYEEWDKENFDINQMETVLFGVYPQSDPSGSQAEQIEWIVLEKDEINKKMLLLSKYIIDFKPWHLDSVDITWEDSFLRQWLNGPFYEYAFNSIDRSKIITSHLVNNPGRNGSNGGNDTDDKVFCLSIEEAVHYFSNDDNKFSRSKAAAKVTKFAENVEWGDKHIHIGGYGGCFWLRSPGDRNNYAANIFIFVSVGGQDVTTPEGVRPALWVSFE